MNEVELESLLVRIKGDGEHYEGVLKHAQEATDRFVESVARAAEAYGIEEVMRSSFEKFEEFESVHRRLHATLEANGRDAAHLTEEYEGYAAALSKVSILSKDQGLRLLQEAEGFRVTGAAANQAAKEAAALAALTGHSADAMLRLTAAMSRGDLQMAERMGRLVPQLRGIRDSAEFAAQYTKLVAAGTKVMAEEADSAGGKLKKLGQAWEDVQIKLGAVVSEGLKPFLDHALRVADLLKDLPPEFYEWAAGVGAATIAFLALGPALKLISIAMSPLVSLVSGLFDVAMVVAGTMAWLAWSAAVLVAKGAVWLLNVAMGVFNLTTLGPTLLLFQVLATTLGGVTAVLYGVYGGFKAVREVLSGISTETGPVKVVVDLTGEWYERLKRIVDLVQTDLPGAWGYAKIASQLAVSQVKDLWPPLWEFVKGGWDVVWDEFKSGFIIGFSEGLRQVFTLMQAAKVYIKASIAAAFSSDPAAEKAAAAAGEKLTEALAGGKDGGKHWKIKIKELTDQFNAAFKESDVTKGLREQLDRYDLFLKVRAAFRNAFKSGADDAKNKSDLGEIKISPKFDSAAWNSAEMRTRVDEWKDKMGLGANNGIGEALRRQKDAQYDPSKDPDHLKWLRESQNAKYNPKDDFGGGSFEKQKPDVFYEIRDVLKDIRKQNADAPRIGVGDDTGEGVF